MVRKICCMFLGLIVAASLIQTTWAEKGRGRHKRLYIVPKPGTVSIDGKLNDWDLSGQITMFVFSETKETQSADYAMMYDSDALYIGAELKDPNPMMNRHDPNKEDYSRGYWAGDACQIRMGISPEVPFPLQTTVWDDKFPKLQRDIIHMTLWHYTDDQEPCLRMKYGFKKGPDGGMYYIPDKYDNGVIPPDKFQAAYRKGEDGMSYTMEYRIPWETLGADNPPQGGDLVPGTVQFNWSRPDGLRTAGGSAWAYDVMSSSGVTFQRARTWGKMIFSEGGDIPEDLVQKGVPPEKPLPLTFEYDLQKAGKVTLALYNEKGTMVRQIVTEGKRNAGHTVERWDGLNAYGRPLPAGEYTWKGLYHEGLDLDYKVAVHNSGQPPYPTSADDSGWGANWGNVVEACAIEGGMLLSWPVTEGCDAIIFVDHEGRKQWGIGNSARHLAAGNGRFYTAGGSEGGKGGIRMFDAKERVRLSYADDSSVLRFDSANENGVKVSGLAWADNNLYVSYRHKNRIVRFNLENAERAQTWKVNKPGRLAVNSHGDVVAISDNTIIKTNGKKVTRLIEEHLDSPKGLAVDGKDRIYVANRGELQNVSVFSPEGEYRRSIGKKGGRPKAGKWMQKAMRRPNGLDVDAKNQLWVAETTSTPKRVSVWKTSDGSVVDEYFGAGTYNTYASMDATDPNHVYCHGVSWRVDLDKGTKRPEAVVAPDNWGDWGHMRVFTAENGRQYAASRMPDGMVLLMRKGDRFQRVAAVVCRKYFKDQEWYSEKDGRGWRQQPMLWFDQNSDFTPQKTEIVEIKGETPVWGGDGFKAQCLPGCIGPDLSFYCVVDSGTAKVLAPERIRSNGIPVYSPGKVQEYDPPKVNEKKIPRFEAGSIIADTDAVYALGGPEPPRTGAKYPVAHPAYPQLNKFSHDGKHQWGFWRIQTDWHAAMNMDTPERGTVLGVTELMGVAGGYLMASSYLGHAHIWSHDGVYVGHVFTKAQTGETGSDVIGCEWHNGGDFVKTDDDRYFVLAGDQAGRVNEVTGLDTVERLKGGTYTISEADHKKVVKAQAEYETKKAKSQKLFIARGREALKSAEGVTKNIDADRAFTAKVAYDKENLYVLYEVDTPFPLTNTVKQRNTVFSGGNCLDIQMATNPETDPDRTEPAPGDIRLVVTRQDGELHAVLYRPEVKGFDGDPIVLESPVDEESFDRIKVVSDDINLDHTKQPKGFKAMVTVPLALIGWDPEPRQKVKMDLGYIFGDKTGSAAALRSYWMNNSFEAKVVDDIPDESRLNPEHWGKATVE